MNSNELRRQHCRRRWQGLPVSQRPYHTLMQDAFNALDSIVQAAERAAALDADGYRPDGGEQDGKSLPWAELVRRLSHLAYFAVAERDAIAGDCPAAVTFLPDEFQDWDEGEDDEDDDDGPDEDDGGWGGGDVTSETVDQWQVEKRKPMSRPM